MSEVKHRDLKIAVIDDNQEDNISFDVKCKDDTWHGTMNELVLDGTHDRDDEIRITPDCTYAFNKILELGGKEALDKYKHWIGGGVLELYNTYTPSNAYWMEVGADENPLDGFLQVVDKFELRIKKAMKTQVLWVCEPEAGFTGDSGRASMKWSWQDAEVTNMAIGWKRREGTRQVEA